MTRRIRIDDEALDELVEAVPLLSDALDAIGTTLPAATTTDPYVIKIAPGLYDETAPVELVSHVDVEGSGQEVTSIRCACASNYSTPGATVRADGIVAAEIRHLSVVNTGGNLGSTGISNVGGSLSMLHVTATAAGGTIGNVGIANQEATATMNDVTATASGGQDNFAVQNQSSTAFMDDVTATANGGRQAIGVKMIQSTTTMTVVTAAAVDGEDFNHGAEMIMSSSL